jgi:DNA-binding CsgD family transcriptional regulator
LPLIGAVIITHYIETEREGSSTKPQAPYKTYLLFFGLIFCFCINGGIMYNTIMPSFISLDFFSYDTVILPYVGGLLFMWFFGKKLTTIFPMYLSTGLMGLGFLAFALLRTTYLGFFTGGLLILFSLGVLDVFLWTILGQIAENYGNPFKVFGWGLSINVLALSFGGLLVQEWLMPNPEGYLITPLLAAGLIFIVIMLIPAFALRIEEDLLARLPKDPSLKVGELQTFPELSALRFLTRREQEIAVLILNGDSNKEIADKLFISENTVKVHQKSINQKMGISGKQDLLALAVKALNRRSHDLTLS